MHYFSNRFSKIAKCWGFFAPSAWWPEVPWFGQIVVFEADYDEIEIQNIVMMSFQWLIIITSPKNVTKITSQIFFQFGPLPIKISG